MNVLVEEASEGYALLFFNARYLMEGLNESE